MENSEKGSKYIDVTLKSNDTNKANFLRFSNIFTLLILKLKLQWCGNPGETVSFDLRFKIPTQKTCIVEDNVPFMNALLLCE